MCNYFRKQSSPKYWFFHLSSFLFNFSCFQVSRTGRSKQLSASLQGYGLVGALITVCIERFLTIYLLLMVVTQRECYSQIYMYVCVYAHTHIIYIYIYIYVYTHFSALLKILIALVMWWRENILCAAFHRGWDKWLLLSPQMHTNPIWKQLSRRGMCT